MIKDTVFKRDISDEIQKYLNTDNIIVLHGARQVGKTHILYYLQNLLTARQQQSYFFDLEDSRMIELLDQGVDALLVFLQNEGFDLKALKASGKKMFLFVDEIQYLKNPSPLLKLLADHHKYLQLIVSGSSSFDIKSKFSDSLVGRTVNFEVYNLSFKELLRFKGINLNLSAPLSAIHLQKLKTIYHEYIFYGGYPKVVLEPEIAKKEKYLQQIVDTYVKKDVRDLANIKDIQKFNNFLKILAAQNGQMVNMAALAKISSLNLKTIENYLFILENTYVIKLLKPFSTSPKIEVTKTPKVFFFDTGLLQILWLRGLQKNILGSMFETTVFSELVKKYGLESVNYWRTKNQQEIDFILSIKRKILPIEVKLNFKKFQRTAIHLFRQKYKTSEYKVVGLEGEKAVKNASYPWDV